jgi:hypothetical protein
MKNLVILVAYSFLFLVAVGGEATALEKPPVEVEFILADPDYLGEFHANDIDFIEKAVTELLVEQFQRRFDYLNFSSKIDSLPANIDSATRKILTCELNRRNPKGTGEFHDVGIHVGLSIGGQSSNKKRIFWLFRSLDDIDRIEASKEDFVIAVNLVLEDTNYSDLVKDVLGTIAIATDGQVVTEGISLACIIPLRSDELCMDQTSVLELVVIIPTAFGPSARDFDANFLMDYNPSNTAQFPEYLGMIVTEILEGEHSAKLRNANQSDLQVEGVYIKEYHLKDYCGGSLPPDEAFATEGGTQ